MQRITDSHLDRLLDDALASTFPASDPIALTSTAIPLAAHLTRVSKETVKKRQPPRRQAEATGTRCGSSDSRVDDSKIPLGARHLLSARARSTASSTKRFGQAAGAATKERRTPVCGPRA
jgi:hypothetical protein